MFAALANGTTYTSPSKKRWTTANSPYKYDTEETYSFIDNTSEKFRMQWEMYEGSIALT